MSLISRGFGAVTVFANEMRLLQRGALDENDWQVTSLDADLPDNLCDLHIPIAGGATAGRAGQGVHCQRVQASGQRERARVRRVITERI